MADWLSSSSSTGEGCKKLSSVNRFCSQIACVVAFELAIYSASVEEGATVGCFFEDQATALPLMRNT